MKSDSSEIKALSDLKEVKNNAIKNINSYAMSSCRMWMAIATKIGLAVLNTHTLNYISFQKNSPFYINEELPCGVARCSIISDRTEVAIVPEYASRKYSTTCVYIFDFRLRTILYSNDFCFPILRLHLSNFELIVTNQRKLLIYNYENDFTVKDERYYLEMYKQKNQNQRLRFFRLYCKENSSCACGEFVVSTLRPFKLLFQRISSLGADKNRLLLLYDQRIDKEHIFQTIPYEQVFAFAIANDASFLAYTENCARNIKIFNLRQNCMFCVLWLGRQISRVLSCGFIKPTPTATWFVAIREKDTGNGTMHIFHLNKQNVTEEVVSKHKRYFSLYKRTFKDYEIADELKGPDFFVKNSVLYCISLIGQTGEAIDFSRSGNLAMKSIDTYYKWDENDHSLL